MATIMVNLTMIVFFTLSLSLSIVYHQTSEKNSDNNSLTIGFKSLNYSSFLAGNVRSPKRIVNLNKLCNSTPWENFTLLTIILSGDIVVNPAPSIYPCGYCQYPVT